MTTASTPTLITRTWSELTPSEDNIRYELNGDLDGLKSSIVSRGLIQPLTVSPEDGGHRIIAGHRRHAAIGMAIDGKLLPKSWPIPCLVEDYSETDRRLAMIVENSQREGLHPLDEAVAYTQLRDEYSMTQKEIAEKVGFSQTYVSRRIKGGRLVPLAQAAIRDERISFEDMVSLAELGAGDQSRFMEAWAEGPILALKVSNFVTRVKTEATLAEEARKLVKAGYTAIYEGGPNSIVEFTPEGKTPVTKLSENVDVIEDLPDDVELVTIKVTWQGDVRFSPVRFEDGLPEKVETDDGAAARRQAGRERLKAITDLAASRPGMGRVDVVIAEMLVRSLSAQQASTVCRVLGVDIKEYEVHGFPLEDPVQTLLDEAGSDKRAFATIAVTAGLVSLKEKADPYLEELVDGYNPWPF